MEQTGPPRQLSRAPATDTAATSEARSPNKIKPSLLEQPARSRGSASVWRTAATPRLARSWAEAGAIGAFAFGRRGLPKLRRSGSQAAKLSRPNWATFDNFHERRPKTQLRRAQRDRQTKLNCRANRLGTLCPNRSNSAGAAQRSGGNPVGSPVVPYRSHAAADGRRPERQHKLSGANWATFDNFHERRATDTTATSAARSPNQIKLPSNRLGRLCPNRSGSASLGQTMSSVPPTSAGRGCRSSAIGFPEGGKTPRANWAIFDN
jgi:hypothetical protein